VIFRRKFHGICWKNDFSKLFLRKIPIFPNIFGGKIFLGIFAGKNVRKIGTWWIYLPDEATMFVVYATMYTKGLQGKTRFGIMISIFAISAYFQRNKLEFF
jgi:hypothetical protein